MAEGPFANVHVLLNFTGALPGGEIWSIGLRTGARTLDLEQLQNFCDAVAIEFKTFFDTAGGLKAVNPPSVTFTQTKASLIGLDGKATIIAVNTLRTSAGVAGGQTAPNQVALVVSLRTAVAGRRARGRVYLPFLSPGFTDGTDKIQPSLIGPIVNSFALFVTNVNGIIPVGGSPANISVQSRAVPASTQEVTAVAIGDVADTQRRRRNKVLETYAVVAVTDL